MCHHLAQVLLVLMRPVSVSSQFPIQAQVLQVLARGAVLHRRLVPRDRQLLLLQALTLLAARICLLLSPMDPIVFQASRID